MGKSFKYYGNLMNKRPISSNTRIGGGKLIIRPILNDES